MRPRLGRYADNIRSPFRGRCGGTGAGTEHVEGYSRQLSRALPISCRNPGLRETTRGRQIQEELAKEHGSEIGEQHAAPIVCRVVLHARAPASLVARFIL